MNTKWVVIIESNWFYNFITTDIRLVEVERASQILQLYSNCDQYKIFDTSQEALTFITEKLNVTT